MKMHTIFVCIDSGIEFTSKLIDFNECFCQKILQFHTPHTLNWKFENEGDEEKEPGAILPISRVRHWNFSLVCLRSRSSRLRVRVCVLV